MATHQTILRAEKIQSGRYTRDAWVLDGPAGKPHPLCIVLDAELYLKNVDAVPVFTELMDRGEIPRMTVVFVSSGGATARHEDYTCNENYARFIAEDVVPWAHGSDEKLQKCDNLICGLSLSGLQAAFIAVRHPTVFRGALCQSGSFWWLKDREVRWPRTDAKLWLSVGDKEAQSGMTHPPSGLRQDISQIEGVEQAVRFLESLGATVKYSMHAGGHAAEPWRAELAEALIWLTR